jgi:hypothetical protein
VWKQLTYALWPGNFSDIRQEIPPDADRFYSDGFASWRRSLQTFELFRRLKRRITKLHDDAVRVQDLISKYLDIKSKYSIMKQAHWTMITGAAVFVFTVTTVIFAPLSFVIALLAMPTSGYLGTRYSNNGTNTYAQSFIGKWMGTFSP